MENNDKNLLALDQLLELAAEHEKRKSNENKYQLMIDKARKRYRRLFLSYGSAAIIVLFVGVVLLENLKPTLTSIEIFEQNYTRYHFDHEYRSENSDFEAFSKAVTEYESGSSEQCIHIISPVVLKNPNKTEYQLLMGLALLESEQYQEALPWLESVSEQGGTYEPLGLWYQGLAYLAMNQSEVAVRHFERLLILDNSDYSKKAKGIIKKTKH